jgi:hypothetical protein
LKRLEGDPPENNSDLSMMKSWGICLLIAAAGVFVGYVTAFVAQRRDVVTQGGNSSRALHDYPALRDGRTSNMIRENKDDQYSVPQSLSTAGSLDQDINEEDRKFLSFSTRGRVLDYDFITWFT